MGKIEIDVKKQVDMEGRVLCMKLMICPDKFTLFDLSRLKEIMRAEGYQVD